MEAIEVKAALDAIKEQALNLSQEAKNEMKALADDLQAKNATQTETLEAMQKHLDILDAKSQEKKASEANVTFDGELASEIKANFEVIKGVKKGSSAGLSLKVVGTMTAANNITPANAVINTYQQGISLIPSQLLNFSQLVPTVNSATGSYVVYREIAGEGSIATQTLAGDVKSQIDFDAQAVTYNATYLAGFAKYAKQMAQDLPFLTSWLPSALRREYFIAENARFHTALAAAATAVPAGTLGNEIERIIKVIALLEGKNYGANGVVINPADWAKIAITEKSAGSGYGLPGIVTINNGQLAINGVNVYKANWIPAGKYAVGDWSMAKKVVVDGLMVEFFEQDTDNVQRNLITARIEERNVLAFDRPDAFYYGDFAAV
jgi:HK97 family phage major capsid protein